MSSFSIKKKCGRAARKKLLMNCLLILLFCFIGLSYAQKQKPLPRQPTPTPALSNDSLSFLPEGAIIHARKNNIIYCFLPKDMEIQGVWCRGHNNDWETGFYTNGRLALAWLPHDQMIQNIPCMAASFWTEVFSKSARVQFHPNGKLARCKLSRDGTIQGRFYEKGTIVHFDEQGRALLNINQK